MSDQIDLFSYAMPRYKIDKPCRMIELFAGIGSQYTAMQRLGVDCVPYRVVEWDRFAIASYNAIHQTDFEPMDITKIHAEDLGIVERDKYIYFLTYSFPCQDISGAGKQAGLSKGSGTRSGLLWEVERILDECGEDLPQVLLMENVPLLISKRNLPDFQLWRKKLESLHYTNWVSVLNSKDYGIPQNRARVFMVSIFGDYYYEFPQKQKLELRLKDMLEDKVDDKYYVSDKAVRYITKRDGTYAQINGDIGITLTAKGQNNWTGDFIADEPSSLSLSLMRSERAEEEALTDIRGTSLSRKSDVVAYVDKGTGMHQSNQVHSVNGLARTLDATDYKHTMKILENEQD